MAVVKTKLKYVVYVLIFLLISIFVWIVILFFQKYQISPKVVDDSFQYYDSNTDMDIIARKKIAIGNKYPEFKDFEKQSSFAGQGLKVESDGSDHYFVYMVYGSGIPIVKGTCFRVDRGMNIYKVGEFPDMLDSYAGYSSINPQNCIGIK